MNAQVLQIGVERVHPGRWQPRDRAQLTDESLAELAADIKQRGILNPLLGAPMEGDGPIRVELVAGERRWLAARLAGLTSVPVRVVQGDDAALQEMAIVDNLQREDLTPLEEARALKALVDLHGYSQRQLAGHLNKSQAWVQQRLALLEAAPAVQEMVNTRVFSLAHARALSGLPDAVQEVAAGYLTQEADRGMNLTSRQIENAGRKIRQFLDVERLAGVEQQAIDPETRNYLIALRYELETADGERIAQAVERLMEAKPGSEEARQLGKDTLNGIDACSLVSLMRNPKTWTGCFYRPLAGIWTDEVARATGRTCAECVFAPYARPDPVYSSWRSPCLRWVDPEKVRVSCPHCLLATDLVAIPFDHWRFHVELDLALLESNGGKYLTSVETYVDFCQRVGALEEADAARNKAGQDVEKADHLTEFRRRCEEASEEEDCPLDRDHFQAHWCERCAFGGEHPCEFIANQIGSKWDNRPELGVWIQVEQALDVEEKPYLATARVVPRCEMFQYVELPLLQSIGWLAFPKDGGGRRLTAIRWLEAMCASSAAQLGSGGIWSTLRWLPYKRHRGRHYQRDALLAYVLRKWDELGDGRVGALLNAAASESSAMGQQTNSRSPGYDVYNPALDNEERWIAISWQSYRDGRKPFNWPDGIEWPFVEEGRA